MNNVHDLKPTGESRLARACMCVLIQHWSSILIMQRPGNQKTHTHKNLVFYSPIRSKCVMPSWPWSGLVLIQIGNMRYKQNNRDKDNEREYMTLANKQSDTHGESVYVRRKGHSSWKTGNRTGREIDLMHKLISLFAHTPRHGNRLCDCSNGYTCSSISARS